jgi:tetratricopeptide (TPR) repeat protein
MSQQKANKGFVFPHAGSFYSRLGWTVIAVIIILFVVRHGWALFCADRTIRPNYNIEDYSRAIKLDPGNAKFWWMRGRLQYYSLDSADPNKAVHDYRKALSLNPYLDRAWTDLAEYLERIGNNKDAETALDNAIRVHRYSPIIHWQAGNYFLRAGNLPRMYDSFKTAITYDTEKLGIAVQMAWNVDVDRTKILQKLVPDIMTVNMAYFNYLVSNGELDLARPAWERALKNEIPEDYEFKASTSFAYINRLLAANRVEDAERVWAEVLRRIGRYKERPIIKTPGLPDVAELMWNNSFENEIVNGGLGWSMAKSPNVQFEMDRTNCMDGLKCLKIEFGGTNLLFSHLTQIVPIPRSGDYLFEFNFRADGLTTDQRPYFSIQGYPDASGAVLHTDPLPESAEWTVKSYGFSVKEGCKAIRLTLLRNPSSKFDNQIKGAMWLDSVSIHSASASLRP